MAVKKCTKCGNKSLQTTTTYYLGESIPCQLCVECGEEFTTAADMAGVEKRNPARARKAAKAKR